LKHFIKTLCDGEQEFKDLFVKFEDLAKKTEEMAKDIKGIVDKSGLQGLEQLKAVANLGANCAVLTS